MRRVRPALALASSVHAPLRRDAIVLAAASALSQLELTDLRPSASLDHRRWSSLVINLKVSDAWSPFRFRNLSASGARSKRLMLFVSEREAVGGVKGNECCRGRDHHHQTVLRNCLIAGSTRRIVDDRLLDIAVRQTTLREASPGSTSASRINMSARSRSSRACFNGSVHAVARDATGSIGSAETGGGSLEAFRKWTARAI